jgi:ribosomal-protein-alanine N-acetyltransferase
MAHDTVRHCVIETDRLSAGDWHEFADRYRLDLVDVVRTFLTPATTTALPPDWQGDFDEERAGLWMSARDAESATLLVIELETRQPVGLLILSEAAGECEQLDVRLGYVLAEAAWGRGLASELVGALVEWARSEPFIESISGGVAATNDASAHVLGKTGFQPTGVTGGEHTYRLNVSS